MKKNYLIFTALIAFILLLSGCKKEEYVVTFNPNGGKGSIVTQTFTVKISQPLMANYFTNSGFTFAGWNSRPNGNGTFYKDLEIVKISENMVLYAQWTKATGDFTVTFNANGGEGDMEPQIFTAELPQAIAANRFICNMYSFSGWCTSPTGKGKKFDNQQIISITSNMTLYAQWERSYKTYFIFFDANGGEGTMDPQAFVEGISQKLDTNKFVRDGYLFKNWNTLNDGTGWAIPDNASIKVLLNTKLFAQWEKE